MTLLVLGGSTLYGGLVDLRGISSYLICRHVIAE